MSIYKNFIADGLTGGTSRKLDSFPIAGLTTGDRAFVSDSGNFYYFKFDSTAVNAENTTTHPYYVRPDDFATAGVWVEQQTSGGSGTVTSVSVTTANGVSGTVATATTTPAITLTLGVITPTSVNGLTLTAQAVGFTISGGTTSKTLTVPLDASVSGTNTGDNVYWNLASTVLSPTTPGNSVGIPINDIKTTVTDGFSLQNNTPSDAVNTVQMPPVFSLAGNVWKSGAGAANYTDKWIISSLPVSAATPTGLLKIGFSANGAAYSYPMTLTSTGNAAISGNVTVNNLMGIIYGSTIARVILQNEGVRLYKNFASASSAVAIDQTAAGATGNILDLQWQSINRAWFTKEGYQYLTMNSADTLSGQINFQKSRGTLASPTVITSGDLLGEIVAHGHDGTNYLNMAGIKFVSTGTIGNTRVPTKIEFYTATDAAPSVKTLAATIDNAGIITPAGGYKSTDGTAGETATITIAGLTNITVKNGLVVAHS